MVEFLKEIYVLILVKIGMDNNSVHNFKNSFCSYISTLFCFLDAEPL